jgi:Protein of unknown function, DUF547
MPAGIKTFLRVVLLLLSFNSQASSPDWRAYADVLQQHVHTGIKHGVPLALIDYAQLKQSGQLAAVYQQIKQFSVASLNSREEKLAFYINTYNILALKMVLDHWPVDSIKDVGSLFRPVWGKTAGIIGGREVSLDDIENGILRPMHEPRIHLAIVCASVSCPDLRTEPYQAEKLNSQLNEQVRLFLQNDKKGLWIGKRSIHASKIFTWFEEDFATAGGVEAFIRSNRPDLPPLNIEADIDYDWAVNGITQ